MKHYNLNSGTNGVLCEYTPTAEFEYTDIDGNKVTGVYQLSSLDNLDYLGCNMIETDYHKTLNSQEDRWSGPVDMKKPIYITIKPALKYFEDEG